MAPKYILIPEIQNPGYIRPKLDSHEPEWTPEPEWSQIIQKKGVHYGKFILYN
ncbi:MAG: hypothetical protein WAO52_05545 [Prolixibacteraceae bacterium]